MTSLESKKCWNEIPTHQNNIKIHKNFTWNTLCYSVNCMQIEICKVKNIGKVRNCAFVPRIGKPRIYTKNIYQLINRNTIDFQNKIDRQKRQTILKRIKGKYCVSQSICNFWKCWALEVFICQFNRNYKFNSIKWSERECRKKKTVNIHSHTHRMHFDLSEYVISAP